MILYLIECLQLLGYRVPAVFGFYSTRIMLAALTSLLFSIFVGQWFINVLYSWKVGQPIRMEECPLLGELHHKKQDTPTMGGLLVLMSMVLSLLLWMEWSHPFTLLLLMVTLVLGALGGYDDYLKLKHKSSRGLSGKKKLIVQAVVAACVASYLLFPSLSTSLQSGGWFKPPVVKEFQTEGESVQKTLTLQEYGQRIYLPFVKGVLVTLSGWWSVAAFFLILFVVMGASNAVNLTDGLDGLAAGSLIMVSITFLCFAFAANNSDLARYLNILYVEGSGEIAIYLSAFIGACLGFLWYNGHPAQVFMGDTGSLALGGVLGVAAVLLKRELLLGLVGAIFVAEALSVILQVVSYRCFNKRRIFLIAPLHHHFEYKGWPETKVVIRFWIIGFLLTVIGLASLKFQ